MKLFSLIWIFCITAASLVQVFTVDTFNEVQELKFKLVGQELFVPYETFQGLPDGICSNLTSLHLEYLEFDPNELVQSLEGCSELKSITLREVEFLNPVAMKVTLPKLEKFDLTMYDIEANTAAEFMDHLFFFKNQAGQTIPETVKEINLWSFSDREGEALSYRSEYGGIFKVSNMKYDLTKYFNYQILVLENSLVDHESLKANSLTSLTLSGADYHEGLFETLKSAYCLREFVIKKPDKVNHPHTSIDLSIFPSIENFTDLSIENVEIWSSKWIHLRKLRFLELKDCEFNLTLISVSNSLYDLDFRQVKLIGDDLNAFLSRMNKLWSISLDYIIGIPGQKIDLMSLGNSSDVLNYMRFSGMLVQISSRHLKFFNVYSLSFIECAFDAVENVHTCCVVDSIFPYLDRVVLHRNNLSYSLLQEILNSSVSTVELTPRKFEVPEISKFLQDSGVPSGYRGAQLLRSENSATGWRISYSYNGRSNPYPYTTGSADTVLYAYILLLIAVCVFGLFGSVLSCIVLTRKNMWGSTSCILLGLTFCDSVVLASYIYSVLYFGIRLIFGFLKLRVSTIPVYQILGFEVTEFSIKRLDDFQYSLLYPLNKTAYTGSVYATVLLTIERYVAVCWPLHARQFLRTRVAVTSILIVLGFSIILNFPRWIEAQQYNSYILFDGIDRIFDGKRLIFYRYTHASGLLRNRYYRQYYHGWIWITLMYILPISGLMVLNVLILKQLRKSNQNRKALAASNQRNNEVNQKELQLASLTKMLLCVVMIFVLCNSVSGCIVWVFINHGWDPMDVEIFSCIPLIINSSINFVIYVLLGSKFRTELRNLIFSISSWRNVICSTCIGSRRSEQAENNVRPTPIPLVQIPSSPQQLS